MVEEVGKNIYRIGVVMPNNPLKELNSYFIRGGDSDLLIDTGFRRQECRDALTAGLAELGSESARRDVLVTHMHSDHSGLSSDFVGEGRRIYMSKIDLKYLGAFMSGDLAREMRIRYLSEAFPEDLANLVEATNPARIMALLRADEHFCGLNDGDVLNVGDYNLRMVLVPGHTPGNSMFWMEEQKTMFTGDHVLFDITPNITFWMNVKDSLGDYLQSLRRTRDYPVERALPGHRKTGDYHRRVDELLAHHDRRLVEVLNVIHSMSGLSAYDISAHMKWKIRADSWETFPPVQKWFAVGECMSHLDYLRKRGVIYREMTNGIWLYYAA